MRFNRRGDLAAGKGGEILSINRVPIAHGEASSSPWWTEDTLIANAVVDSVWGLWAFDRATNWAGRLIDFRGASNVGAGGGNWAATLESHPFQTYGSFNGGPLPEFAQSCHVLCGGEDGTLILASSDYLEILVLPPNGIAWGVDVGPHVFLSETRWIPNGFLFVRDPRELWVCRAGQMSRVSTVEPPYQPSLVTGDWYLYHNSRTILQNTAAQGFTWNAGYAPDGYLRPDGLVQIAYAEDEAESPDRIVLPPPVALSDAQPITPPIVYPVIPPFLTPVSIAVFKDPEGTSGSDSEVVIDGAHQAPGDHRPYWATLDSAPAAPVDRLYGLYTEDQTDWPALIARAERLHTRIAWLHDGPYFSGIPQALRPYDQVWLELYRLSTESLDGAIARWQSNLHGVILAWSGDLGIVPPYYTQNLWTDQEAVDTIAAALDIQRLLPARIKVIAPFEYSRANGITGNAAIRVMYDRTLKASIHGLPTFIPVPPVPPPPRKSSILPFVFREFTMSSPTVPQVLSGSQFNSVPGGFTVTFTNPLDQNYVGFPPKGTTLPGHIGPDAVVSVEDSDGSIYAQKPGTVGAFEVCTKQGNLAVWKGWGTKRYVLPFAD